jgi:integrase
MLPGSPIPETEVQLRSGTVLPSPTATPLTTGKRGPVAKRRFQKGCLQIKNGTAYCFYYADDQRADGTTETRKVRQFIGRVGADGMSPRAAEREHDRIMQEVNQKRGSVAPTIHGQTFTDAVNAWRRDVAPNLSPSTVRQRESYLKTHVLPKFKDSAPHALGVPTLQQFATGLRRTLSRKSIENILGTVFAILKYADKCGMRTSKVGFGDLLLGSSIKPKPEFFSSAQALAIIQAAPEPYKTLFAVASGTGARAGEILALTVSDLNFEKKTISISKSADDNTREIRQPKTDNSEAMLPMPSALESVLQNYLANHWEPNLPNLLFPNRKGTHPRWRDNVVKYGLKPVLKALKMPTKEVGLHAFRHGLATELADQSAPLPVLQQQMRHADIRTTLRVYAHVISKTHREFMESVGQRSIGTNVPIRTEKNA